MTAPATTGAISLVVNGQRHERVVAARKTLADFLREDLQLTGTHLGCEHGVCGACTVLLDGQAVRSCLLFAIQVDGCSLTTVEGLAGDAQLHPLQRAFWEEHALQCGFCTPGFLITAAELLAERPNATDAEITEAIDGNLCRCTGYAPIVRAVQAVRDAAQSSYPDEDGSAGP